MVDGLLCGRHVTQVGPIASLNGCSVIGRIVPGQEKPFCLEVFLHMRPQFVSVHEVAAMFGVSRATIWRWASSGNLPKPIKLGPNTTRWRTADLERRLSAAE